MQETGWAHLLITAGILDTDIQEAEIFVWLDAAHCVFGFDSEECTWLIMDRYGW